MTFTPSPCLCWCAAIGESECSAPVSTRRMRPWLQDVGDAVAHAGLQAGVGDLLEAERVAVVEGGLRGVADVQLDVVDAVERHEVFGGGSGCGDGWCSRIGSVGAACVQ